MKPGLTAAEMASLPTATDLLTAARALGLGSTRAYQAAVRRATNPDASDIPGTGW